MSYKKSIILNQLEQAMKKKAFQKGKQKDQANKLLQSSVERRRQGAKKQNQPNRVEKSHSFFPTDSHFNVTRSSNRKLDKLISLIQYVLSSSDKVAKHTDNTHFQAQFAVKLYRSDKQNLLNQIRSLSLQDFIEISKKEQVQHKQLIQQIQRLKREVLLYEKQAERSYMSQTKRPFDYEGQKYRESLKYLLPQDSCLHLIQLIEKQAKYETALSKYFDHTKKKDDIQQLKKKTGIQRKIMLQAAADLHNSKIIKAQLQKKQLQNQLQKVQTKINSLSISFSSIHDRDNAKNQIDQLIIQNKTLKNNNQQLQNQKQQLLIINQKLIKQNQEYKNKNEGILSNHELLYRRLNQVLRALPLDNSTQDGIIERIKKYIQKLELQNKQKNQNNLSFTQSPNLNKSFQIQIQTIKEQNVCLRNLTEELSNELRNKTHELQLLSTKQVIQGKYWVQTQEIFQSVGNEVSNVEHIYEQNKLLHTLNDQFKSQFAQNLKQYNLLKSENQQIVQQYDKLSNQFQTQTQQYSLLLKKQQELQKLYNDNKGQLNKIKNLFKENERNNEQFTQGNNQKLKLLQSKLQLQQIQTQKYQQKNEQLILLMNQQKKMTSQTDMLKKIIEDLKRQIISLQNQLFILKQQNTKQKQNFSQVNKLLKQNEQNYNREKLSLTETSEKNINNIKIQNKKNIDQIKIDCQNIIKKNKIQTQKIFFVLLKEKQNQINHILNQKQLLAKKIQQKQVQQNLKLQLKNIANKKELNSIVEENNLLKKQNKELLKKIRQSQLSLKQQLQILKIQHQQQKDKLKRQYKNKIQEQQLKKAQLLKKQQIKNKIQEQQAINLQQTRKQQYCYLLKQILKSVGIDSEQVKGMQFEQLLQEGSKKALQLRRRQRQEDSVKRKYRPDQWVVNPSSSFEQSSHQKPIEQAKPIALFQIQQLLQPIQSEIEAPAKSQISKEQKQKEKVEDDQGKQIQQAEFQEFLEMAEGGLDASILSRKNQGEDKPSANVSGLQIDAFEQCKSEQMNNSILSQQRNILQQRKQNHADKQNIQQNSFSQFNEIIDTMNNSSYSNIQSNQISMSQFNYVAQDDSIRTKKNFPNQMFTFANIQQNPLTLEELNFSNLSAIHRINESPSFRQQSKFFAQKSTKQEKESDQTKKNNEQVMNI